MQSIGMPKPAHDELSGMKSRVYAVASFAKFAFHWGFLPTVIYLGKSYILVEGLRKVLKLLTSDLNIRHLNVSSIRYCWNDPYISIYSINNFNYNTSLQMQTTITPYIYCVYPISLLYVA